MNITSFSGPIERLQHKLVLYARLLDTRLSVSSFEAGNDDTIQRIYIINLDRKPDRWRQVSRELRRFQSRSGIPLSAVSRRFSAIDARYLDGEIDDNVLRPYYSLADQLSVEPNERLQINAESRSRRIEMTSQEIAVALSHIEVWKLIAASDVQYTLVLEDDVYFRRKFARNLDKAWLCIMGKPSDKAPFDLLYLSFQEVGNSQRTGKRSTEPIRKPDRGIWYASGYVLSQTGAQKLLDLLPVHGPIDLWLNLQFDKLNVLTTQRSIIEQRIDVPSTNSYSIMPILSQVGAYTREKPIVPRALNLLGPIIACGEPGSGLTALATALSMLGYTCFSDATKLPDQVQHRLFAKRGGRDFNAYVNIGTLSGQLLTEIAQLNPNARFIFTTVDSPHVLPRDRVLNLPAEHKDKWAALSKFLKVEYPAFPYPTHKDTGQRDIVASGCEERKILPFRRLKSDSSPWVLSSKKWRGITVAEGRQGVATDTRVVMEWSGRDGFDGSRWISRNDTFPSNLALFTPDNISVNDSGITELVLREQTTPVRSFTSAAIATQQKFLYGTFVTELRPSNVSGLITGMFLHRNGPHQEIDIEFLGKDTTKMLVNVFYNPGVEGTRLEYGYRGTPALIELGFDAAREFHRYEIEWHTHVIRWRVDGRIVHERVLWNPTPIPNLPMEFDVNLWHSQSKKLAGRLNTDRLPAHAEIRSIQISHND